MTVKKQSKKHDLVTVEDILRNLKKDARNPEKSRAAIQSLAALRAAIQIAAVSGCAYADSILIGPTLIKAHTDRIKAEAVSEAQQIAKLQLLMQGDAKSSESTSKETHGV
jgi:hypothetical protein